MQNGFQMSRLISFIRQPMPRKLLLIEALFRLCHAWFIVRKTGFTKRAPYLGTKHPGDWSAGSPQHMDKIRDVRWAINKACALTGHKFTCLMIGLAGKEMLRRFDIPNALVLGIKRSSDTKSSEMLAHAWLRVGAMIVFGAEAKPGYVPIASYVDQPPHDTKMAPQLIAEPKK